MLIHPMADRMRGPGPHRHGRRIPRDAEHRRGR